MDVGKEEISEKIFRISGVDPKKCMKCGKCSASCPAFHDMDIHPHEFVSMVSKGEVKKLMSSKTLWSCLSCFACVERCPRNVKPANIIEAIRLSLIRKQNENHLNAEDIPELLNDNIPQQIVVSAFRKFSK